MQSCRYDQSAYISYLVDEAVKGADNSCVPASSTQNPHRIVPSSNVSSTHLANFNLPITSGPPTYPVYSNVGFNTSVTEHIQRTPIHRVPPGNNNPFYTSSPLHLLPAPQPEFPASFSPLTNPPRQEAHITANLQGYQTSSFCLNQHIGLQETPVVNASQINNKIQVQFQFGDNDRFTVQSSNSTASRVPDLNWHNLEPYVSENNAYAEGSNIPFVVQQRNSRDIDTPVNTSLLEYGDYSQFCVSNILANNSKQISNTGNINKRLNTGNERFKKQAEEREYYNLFMQKEKDKQKNDVDVNGLVAKGKGNNKKDFEKQKRTDHSKIISKKKTSAKRSKIKEPEPSNEITLLKLSYQCGDCEETYNDITALKKHIKKKHKDMKKDVKRNDEKGENEKGTEIVSPENELVEVFMAKETDEMESMEVESDDSSTKPQSYLCTNCGHESKTEEESEEHGKRHEDEVATDNVERDWVKEAREYLKSSLKQVENKKKRDDEKNEKIGEEKQNNEVDDATEKGSEEDALGNRQIGSVVSRTKKATEKTKDANSITENNSLLQAESRTLPKRMAATQAKNNLMNPSKGKQKRIRDTNNFDVEDTMLLEMYGIIPSKVCLSRVQESEQLKSQFETTISDVVENSPGRKGGIEVKQVIRDYKVEKNQWSKVISMSNTENESIAKNERMFNVEDDSDIEILEPPMTLIVLDEDEDEKSKKKVSPKKSKKTKSYCSKKATPRKSVIDIMESHELKDASFEKSDIDNMISFEMKDVKINFDKAGKGKEIESLGNGKSDAELLEKFGIKDLSVSLAITPTKTKKNCPSPKSKSKTIKKKKESKAAGNVVPNKIEEMTPSQIEKLLYECGMGISVPVQPQGTFDNENSSDTKAIRTPSPVQSTSKGHGHLKRKRTARKSTKDSALFKKYKLKDSKVILKNLSRIDISLIRNPNSPFGKSDWLKHKFDSDTESDFEFDIPTPPLEDFIENTQIGEIKEQSSASPRIESPSKIKNKSPIKREDLEAMGKFGIAESVVIIDSPKKKQTEKLCVSRKRNISDEELRKKFGIPKTLVVIKTPERTADSCKTDSTEKQTAEKKPFISFSDFRSALETARQKILGKMKADSPEKEIPKRQSARKTRRNANEAGTVTEQSTKKRKIEVSEKLNNIIQQKVDHKELKPEESVTKKDNAKRNLRFSPKQSERKVTKAMPCKLKTLTVDLDRLKSNEALKSYKEKAVSRALEAQHKKNRNLRISDKVDNEQKGADCVKSPLQTGKRLRSRETKEIETITVKSVKRKCFDSKDEQGSPEKQVKKERQVLKTARYKHSIIKNEKLSETVKECKLKQLTKGLPIVKVAVPCLTHEEICRLSQSVEKSSVSGKKSEIDSSPCEVASQIIDEIIDKICCKKELWDETLQKTDALSDRCEDQTAFDGSGDCCENKKRRKSENRMCCSPVKRKSNGREKTIKEISESSQVNDTCKQNIESVEKKENLNESVTTVESESDVSLISVTLENKENESKDASGDNKISDDKEENISEEMDKKSVNEIDVIPLGKSKFYEEDINETSHDEVDGDFVDRTKSSPKDDLENFQKSDEKESACEINLIHEHVSLEEENFECSKVNQQLNVLNASSQLLSEKSKTLDNDCFETELNEAIDEKENRRVTENNLSEMNVFDNDETELNYVENTDKNGTECEEHVPNDKITKTIKRNQVLSAIIDSESGSLIGDVYSVDESAGSSTEGEYDKSMVQKESQEQRESLAREPRSRQATPDDIILSLTES